MKTGHSTTELWHRFDPVWLETATDTLGLHHLTHKSSPVCICVYSTVGKVYHSEGHTPRLCGQINRTEISDLLRRSWCCCHFLFSHTQQKLSRDEKIDLKGPKLKSERKGRFMTLKCEGSCVTSPEGVIKYLYIHSTFNWCALPASLQTQTFSHVVLSQPKAVVLNPGCRP